MDRLDNLFNGALRVLRKSGILSPPKVSTMSVVMDGDIDMVNSVQLSLTDSKADGYILVIVRNVNVYGRTLRFSFGGATSPDGTPLEDVDIVRGKVYRFLLARESFTITGTNGSSTARLSYHPIG